MKRKGYLTNHLEGEAAAGVSQALRPLPADVFTLYLNDEQADQLFAITDEIARRARKPGATTTCSSGISLDSSVGKTASGIRHRERNVAGTVVL